MGALVFVDAVVPPRLGFHRTAAATRHLHDQHPQVEQLWRRLEWWPDEVVAALLPNPADRARLLAVMNDLGHPGR